MPASDNEKENGKGGMKGKTCSCGCENCACGSGFGWCQHGHHWGGGFWILRILIAFLVLGFVFCAGVALGHLSNGFGRDMMPWGANYYYRSYPYPMMGGYGAYGAGGSGTAIPPGVPQNGAATSTR